MSAEVQIELVKKVVVDWCASDDCSGVDALIAIIEILNFDPYKKQRRRQLKVIASPAAQEVESDVAQA